MPTYIYIGVLGALVSYGLFRSFVLDDIHRINPIAFKEAGNSIFGGTLGIFILLKGFSSGAVALTGVEAISNGVPAFRRPESKNAAATLVWMGDHPRHAVHGRADPRPPPRARTRASTPP